LHALDAAEAHAGSSAPQPQSQSASVCQLGSQVHAPPWPGIGSHAQLLPSIGRSPDPHALAAHKDAAPLLQLGSCTPQPQLQTPSEYASTEQVHAGGGVVLQLSPAPAE
jgi:hypothetical protein